MAITVPDDSYISIADADTYWSNHGSPSDWTGASDADKEAALRFATEYIDAWGEGKWIGVHPGSISQVRSWPRNKAVDSQGRTLSGSIPQRIKDATARLALDLIGGYAVTSEGRKTVRERVGEIEVEYEPNDSMQDEYPYLRTMLKGLIRSRRMVRA